MRLFSVGISILEALAIYVDPRLSCNKGQKEAPGYVSQERSSPSLSVGDPASLLFFPSLALLSFHPGSVLF